MNDRHTAIYRRVSTVGQHIEAQGVDLDRWAMAHGGPIVNYEDTLTGTNQDRPGFQRMMEAARAGRVSQIVVWRLDRLGRNAAGLHLMFQELRALGVGLRSLTEGIDLSSVAGRIVAAIFASMAEYECELRAERQRVGIEAARRRQERVKELGVAGLDAAEIAHRTGEPEERVRRMLAAPDGRIWWATGRERGSRLDLSGLDGLLERGLTTAEAAKVLGCAVRTVQRRLREREITKCAEAARLPLRTADKSAPAAPFLGERSSMP